MADALAVILCTYSEQRWDDLLAAVASVCQQTLPATEIIIVVDHNLPLLARVQHHLPEVIALENTQEQGLSGARNSGVAAARSEILVFLDDDAVAAPDWLWSLHQAFAPPEVLGVGGSILPRWATHKPGWFPEEFYWVVGCSYQGMPKQQGTVRNLIGANMAFRRELFTVEQGFRTDVGRRGTHPLGCEETELCIRAGRRWPQRPLLYQPSARVSHHIPEQRTCWSYFCARCYGEGRSKAAISRSVGARSSLASERVYTLRTLPRGVLRHLGAVVTRHDPAGLGRAGAILAGLGITTVGYLVGVLHGHLCNVLSGPSRVPSVAPTAETTHSFTARTSR